MLLLDFQFDVVWTVSRNDNQLSKHSSKKLSSDGAVKHLPKEESANRKSKSEGGVNAGFLKHTEHHNEHYSHPISDRNDKPTVDDLLVPLIRRASVTAPLEDKQQSCSNKTLKRV